MNPIFVELKRLIGRSGMSYFNLAQRAGLNERTIRMWMDGKTLEPELGSLVAVAKLFGRHIELTDDGVHLVADTPASVAAKMSGAREFVGLWRKYQ